MAVAILRMWMIQRVNKLLVSHSC